jgi:hypothetical protein
VANFRHFVKIIFFKNPVTHSLSYKKSQNTNFLNIEIAKNFHNCLQYESMLKIFLLTYFEYSQIWLNMLMDHCHLSNITKLKNKTRIQPQKLDWISFVLTAEILPKREIKD